MRIKNVHYGVEEKYTYDTVAELSRLLTRTVGSSVTKYVYGLGLISEETNNTVKVYHFDYRGSTVAVTDSTGAITDTFEYDTYGLLTSRTGTSDIIFCYNGRDGVVTDKNGLFYMRARYYSPDMRRFVNADIIAGEISEAITLNRYAYANGNPVSNVDPFGLSSKNSSIDFKITLEFDPTVTDGVGWFLDLKNLVVKYWNLVRHGFYVVKTQKHAIVHGAKTIAAISQGIKRSQHSFRYINDYSNVFSYINANAAIKETLRFTNGKGKLAWGNLLGYSLIAADVICGVWENVENGTRIQKTISDAVVDAGIGLGTLVLTSAISGAIGGSPIPIFGNIVGALAGVAVGFSIYFLTDIIHINGKSGEYWLKEGAGFLADLFVNWGTNVADFAVDAWDCVTDTASDIWGSITNTAGDVWDSITDTTGNVWDSVADFFW